MPPRQVHQYNLMSELGRGGYAAVYKAFNRENRRTYAIKVFPKTNLKGEREIQRFQLEVNTATFIRHDNLVALHDFFWDDENFYLVEDFCAGGDLFHYVAKNGAIEETVAALVFSQVAKAIAHMHSFGVAHRDIKPENVLIERWPRVRVCDFGLVGYTNEDQKMSTFIGSTSYLAPECVSKVEYDGKVSDVWSLGVLLYVLVTGTNPWTQENTAKMIQEITTGDYYIPDNVSEGCADLIRRMLVTVPESRATMEEVVGHPWLELAKSAVVKLPSKAAIPKGQPTLPPLNGYSLKQISQVSCRESQVRETRYGIVSPFEKTDDSGSESASKRESLPNFCIRSTSFDNLSPRGQKKRPEVVNPILARQRQFSSTMLINRKPLPPIKPFSQTLGIIEE